MDIVNGPDIEELKKRDKLFLALEKQYGIPPNWRRRPGFVSLCRIILEQQVSLNAARAHYLKLRGYLGKFTYQNILRLSDTEFRQCQISRQKMSYLRALAREIESGSIHLGRLSRKDPEEIRRELMRIKGIGNWTVDIYLLFCLQNKDILPLGDIAIRKAITELTGAKTEEEVIGLSRRWKPLRSLAAYFLWHYYLSSRKKAFPFDAGI